MKRFSMFLILLVLMSLACETIMGKPSQATSQSPAGQAPFQPPVIQIPNLSGVKLGDEVRNEGCGYSFRKIPGYKYDQTPGWSEEMTAPGATSETGPIIFFMCGTRATASTNDDLVKGLTANTSVTNPNTYSNQKNVKIGGVNAVSLDAAGNEIGGITAKGRVIVAMVTPYRVFTMIGMAPSDKWEETRPYFEAVMNSISFFEPTITPTANP